MRNYLFFIRLLSFLIILNSCASNEELNPVGTALQSHQYRIGKLENDVNQLKHIYKQIDSIREVIYQLKTSSINQTEQLDQYKNILEKISNEIKNEEIFLNQSSGTLAILQKQMVHFMEENKIFNGDISISSSEDFILLITKQYKTILGNLTIHFTGLKNLRGLESLTSVGSLTLHNNNFLENTEGINNLIHIGSDLTIRNNPLLQEISLLKTKKIKGSIFLRLNPLLKDLKGLKNVTTVGRKFVIDNIDSLTTLEGLENLSFVGLLFVISENNSLTNLNGLSKLNSVGKLLEISGNDSLTNIDGLNNLTYLGESLEISRNTNLSSFKGLQKIFENGHFTGSFDCWNNAFNPSRNDLVNGNLVDKGSILKSL